MTTVIEFDCPVRFFPMTTAERDAIVNKPDGLVIHNTTTEQIEIWLWSETGGEWNGIQDGHGALVVGNDPDCYLEGGGTSVLWYVDEGDFLAFVRGSNAFTWNIDSIVQASLSGTVLTLCHHFIDLRGLSSSPEPIIADAGNLYCKGSHLYWWGMGQAETDLLDHHARHEGGADAMTVDAAAATGSLRTLGTAATAACAGNDSRLSDARTPTAHDLAGALHNAATLAALNDKISDADIVPNTLFDAQTILVAVTDNTPVALTVAEQKVVGRVTGGNIAALSLNAASGILQLDANARVDPTQTAECHFTVTIETPTDAEDFSLPRFNVAVTITKVVGVLTGDYTSVTINPKHSTDRSAAGNALLSAATAITSTTTGTVITSFSDATIPANSFLWLETTAKTGTAGAISLTFFYTED